MISGNRGFTPLEMSSGVPGKRRSLTGFSIIEVTVAIVITLLICAVIIAISIGLRGSIGVANSTLLITERGRHAANRICMDIREATALLSSHGGYSAGDDTIVLQVPSIDSDGSALKFAELIQRAIETLPEDVVIAAQNAAGANTTLASPGRVVLAAAVTGLAGREGTLMRPALALAAGGLIGLAGVLWVWIG